MSRTDFQLIDWYQVDSTGAIVATGVAQAMHMGDIVPPPGMTLRIGLKAGMYTHYESSPGVLAKYTPAQAAALLAPVSGKAWDARQAKWM